MSPPPSSLRPPDHPRQGVRIAGTGMCLPERRLTNADLERLMDTTDEWIVQRTGIRERRLVDPAKGESCWTLSAEALRHALQDARVEPGELDLIILGTVSSEMPCPSSACRVAAAVGARNAGAFDLVAACCGFVYALNLAHDLIRAGSHRTIGVIGCDILSEFMDYTTKGRGTAILFGDAAGAAILRATDDPSRGIIAQSMHADGTGWAHLFIPQRERDYPEGFDRSTHRLGTMFMHGREIFKFAVSTFGGLIQETLDRAALRAEDIDHYICHQSNARILQAARDRFGIPPEKMYVNIERVGNTSGGSIPVCLHELRAAGRVREGQLVMFVAFGGGLTWASSLWRL